MPEGLKIENAKRALFMHTQKTAGSSVLEMGRQFYGKDNVIGFDQHARLSQQACASVPFLSGHFGFEFARPHMADRYSFTFLRDPIERVLSLYAYAISRPDGEFPIFDAAKHAGLEGFLRHERFRTHVWNHQVWQLACGWFNSPAEKQITDFAPDHLYDLAHINLTRFDYVGFTDTMDTDAIAIFQALGWRAPYVQHVNASPRRVLLTDLSESHLAMLHEVTELDRRLFEHAKRAYCAAQSRQVSLL